MTKRPRRPDNFRYLPPDAPKTRRLIDAMLSANNPLPWEPGPDDPKPEAPPLVELADRISRRAMQGLTVRLTPETAHVVARSLYLVADGVLTVDRQFGHTVQDWTDGPPVVVCYAMNSTMTVAAWNAHAAANLDKVIVARWGGWTMRHSQRHRAKGADQ